MDARLPLLFAAYPLLLSGIAFYWLLGSQHRSWTNWVLRTLACGSIVAFAFVAGPWAFTSYSLRYVVVGLFAVGAAYSYRRMKRRELRATERVIGKQVSSALVFLFFAGLDGFAIASHFPRGETLRLSFPFASGTYYVLQGGASMITNPFHALGDNKLALDIVKLNTLGNRAGGIAPQALGAYEIFGEKLHSPCEGSILKVRDNLPDNPPGNPDADHPEGNYIVLKCDEADVLMAHLKRGSIEVAQWEAVTAGQPIAEVGNSGNSLEPHLHIEGRKPGADMALKFDGRSLSVNSVITRG